MYKCSICIIWMTINETSKADHTWHYIKQWLIIKVSVIMLSVPYYYHYSSRTPYLQLLQQVESLQPFSTNQMFACHTFWYNTFSFHSSFSFDIIHFHFLKTTNKIQAIQIDYPHLYKYNSNTWGYCQDIINVHLSINTYQYKKKHLHNC